eukprot:COSAG01_NODE_47881_length_386_cov_0.721254_1_plen_116_part_10
MYVATRWQRESITHQWLQTAAEDVSKHTRSRDVAPGPSALDHHRTAPWAFTVQVGAAECNHVIWPGVVEPASSEVRRGRGSARFPHRATPEYAQGEVTQAPHEKHNQTLSARVCGL